MGNVYAYVRVSTTGQNEDRQLIAMARQNVPERNIFVEKQSGKDFNRPMYQRMVKKLKEDDVLFIKSIDRLGRNYEEILEQWRILTKEKGVDIVVIDMPLLDTRRGKDLMGTLIADLVLALLSYVSENERKSIRERQREGIEAAKLRGVKFGRPSKPLPEDFVHICNRWLAKEITAEEAAGLCGLTKATFYNRARTTMRRTFRNSSGRNSADL
ncbi:MAG: recombinase family protein [Lachnospiraceae bacterium]|nr:recombinase family protein [Lachnospiraceae bacterium]